MLQTKNTKKSAPVFRYLATREAVNIPSQFDENGQISFMTSDYVEQKLHLEEMEHKTFKVFGIVTNEQRAPLDILLWPRKR